MATAAGRSGGASRSRNGRKQLEGVGDEVDAFSEEELARRPEVRIINKYAVVLAYIRIGLKGLGALALLWATVVLLGGFVSTLNKKDFLSLTLIAFVQAAGLSDAVGDDRFSFFGEWFESLKRSIISQKEEHHHEQRLGRRMHIILSGIINFTLMLIFLPVAIFVLAGPVICVTLSAVRIAKQDYGVADGDTSKANLTPALNLFYYVSLSHGATYLYVMMVETVADQYCVAIVSQRGFSPEILGDYLQETKEMCVNNPASTKSWNLITYGAGLLDSQLPEEYASGGRVLTMLIDQDIPVPITRLLIRSPRQRIQKLLGTLGWGNPAEREMRWLAARIVEHIAGHLNLAQFPGALDCISSLLDASCYNNNGDQEALHLPFEIGRNKATKKTNFLDQIRGDPLVELVGEDGSSRSGSLLMILGLLVQGLIHKKYGTPNNGGTLEQYSNQRENGDKDLILPALRILHKLAHNGDNCKVIYKAKVLLSKLVAPVSSDTLVEDVESSPAWTKVVDGSLKVVSRLMASPGNTGEEMRRQISDDSNAVKNLVAVLGMDINSNNSVIELQIQVIEALTQLALHEPADSARDSSREYLIERALHFFLTNDWMEDYLKDVQMKIDDENTSRHKRQSRPSMGRCMDNFAKRECGERAREKMEAQDAKARENKVMKLAEETASRLKEKAGEALAMMLSIATQANSEAHKSIILKQKDVVHSLTKLLNFNTMTIASIGCRINAAVILKHLSDYVEEETLGKALVELLATQAHPSDASTLKRWHRSISTWCSTTLVSDQENPSDGGQHGPSTLEISHRQKSEERRLQAELLSLVAAIRASKNITFASVLLQPQFALKNVVLGLNQMVDENCKYTTPACLAILKLVCVMVTEFIQHVGKVEVIEMHNILGKLLKASKRMDGLESSLLFSGVDRDCYGVPLKPLSCVLVKRAKDLLTQRQQELDIAEPAGGSSPLHK